MESITSLCDDPPIFDLFILDNILLLILEEY